MMTFETLMAGRKSAEIVCLYKGTVVRTLTVKGATIEMAAASGEKVEVRMGTGITYRPWFMDRGDFQFYVPDLNGPNGDVVKLCTEHDLIRFDDGTEAHVDPR